MLDEKGEVIGEIFHEVDVETGQALCERPVLSVGLQAGVQGVYEVMTHGQETEQTCRGHLRIIIIIMFLF